MIKSVLSRRGGGAILSWENDQVSRVKIPHHLITKQPEAGEVWRVHGEISQSEYGLQLEAVDAARLLPSGEIFIKFLSNNPNFKEVGSKRSQILWNCYGENSYKVLYEESAENIAKQTEIPLSVIQKLKTTWEEYYQETKVIEWLHERGFAVWPALKIARFFGEEAIAKLEEDPYRLVSFLNWKTVDEIARINLGVSPSDERRLIGAVEAILNKNWFEGNTAITRKRLKKRLHSMIDLNSEKDAEPIIDLSLKKNALIEIEPNKYQNLGVEALEWAVSQFMTNRTGLQPILFQKPFSESKLKAFEKHKTETYQTTFKLNYEQVSAIKLVLGHGFGCITGGAGVGKTSVLEAIYDHIDEPESIIQCALTHKAKERMTEATGLIAITITKLLKEAEKSNIPDFTYIFIDEASMIDLPMFYRIITSIPTTSKLYLIGDAHQLPPIGPGLIFHKAVDSCVPTVALKEIHRASAETGIPQASQAIRSNELPYTNDLTHALQSDTGVSFIPCEYSEQQIEHAIYFYRMFEDRGTVTVINPTNGLNDTINTQLHNDFMSFERFEGRTRFTTQNITTPPIAEGEPVIWNKVNYHKRGIFNGIQGLMKTIFSDEQYDVDENGNTFEYIAIVDFNGVGEVKLSYQDLKNLNLAYAITCHKSQGSQWERVVINLQKSLVIDNSWLYTAVTRASIQVIIIGSEELFKELVYSTPKALNRCVGIKL